MMQRVDAKSAKESTSTLRRIKMEVRAPLLQLHTGYCEFLIQELTNLFFRIPDPLSSRRVLIYQSLTSTYFISKVKSDRRNYEITLMPLRMRAEVHNCAPHQTDFALQNYILFPKFQRNFLLNLILETAVLAFQRSYEYLCKFELGGDTTSNLFP